MASENASIGASCNKDIEFESLVNSMTTMLGCVKNRYVQACSISFVPEQLGKSKVEAYTPRKVSIGPLHRGASPDLIYMEDLKWRRMEDLLTNIKWRRMELLLSNINNQNPTKDAEKERLEGCSKIILDLVEILRVSYNVDDIKFKSYDLAKILLLDGCFLLHLFISGSNGVPERELVLSDLTLLGNQIPFIILSKFATHLLPNDYFTDLENGLKPDAKITKSVLSLFGYEYDYPSNYEIDHSFSPVHVLGIVHSFITWEAKEVYAINGVTIDEEDSDKIDEKQLKLKRCATKLEAAGVKIRPTKRKNNNRAGHEKRIRFDLKIIFSDDCDRKLKIPPLHITETTEAKWRNFIAWELTRSPYSESIGCKFIWYALFFQGLVCSVHDIQLLIDRNVIVVHDAKSGSLDQQGEKKKKMSNEDLLAFFRNITNGVRDDQIVKDSQFYKLFQDLNSCPRHLCWVTAKSRILCHFCRRALTAICYYFRNSYKILRREHITDRWKLIVAIAATLTVALSFIQTIFSVPKN